jgi:ACS family hexuronate transporter-like MFS transporter
LKTERGFGFASGNAVSILVFAGLDVGNLSVGFLLRRLIGRGVPVARARRVSLVICCFLMTCAAGAGVAPSAAVSVLLLVATALGVAGFLVIYLTAVQDLDPARVGLSAGLLGGLGNLAYGLVSPWIGRLADLRQSQTAFLLVGLLPWLALAGMWIAAAPRGGVPAEANSTKE